MSTLTIELPDNLTQALQDQGISTQKLETFFIQFVQLYLNQQAVQDTMGMLDQLNNPASTKTRRPRFGSGKHLNIQMSDDFDEPLEDFAEYM